MAQKQHAVYPDHPLYTDAAEALKRYWEARASGSPVQEVERLRQIAESQFRAVNEYQLKALGSPSRAAH
ncbi:hypothetical protein [Pseudomonas putida]|uniref:hypothetical protein n=1 Tax=Pseudomonas putida TaxID=303 RepID=UPI0021677B74|nr:hypothetical protein [Pseudomonas putida]